MRVSFSYYFTEKLNCCFPLVDGSQIASGGGDNLVFLWKSNIRDEEESGNSRLDLQVETGPEKQDDQVKIEIRGNYFSRMD